MHMRLFTVLALLCASAAAESPPVGGLFVSGMTGFNTFGDDRAIKDAAAGTLGMGYRFSSALSMELSGGRTSSEAGNIGGTDVDANTIGLSALWHPLPGASWEAYLLGRVGMQRFAWQGGREDEETLVGVGGGLFHPLAGPFALRLEWRALYSTDHEDVDTVGLIGLTVAFGGDAYPINTD